MKKNLQEFKTYWIQKFSENLKKFPEDFLEGIQCKVLNMPSKRLLPGDVFFGYYQVVDSDYIVHFKVNDRFEYKYIIYASCNGCDSIKIPINSADIKNIIIEYEKLLRTIIKTMESDYKSTFHTTKNFHGLVNNILKSLNIQLF